MCILPPIKALLKIIWLIFFYKSCGGLVAKSCPTLVTPWTVATRLLCPWNSSGKNTGVGCHFLLQCIEVKSESEVAQSCLTLNNPMDCSLPGSSAHEILQARILEFVAISSFRGSSQSRNQTWISCTAGRFFTM